MTIQWLGDIEMYPWIAQVLIGCFKLHFGVLNSDWLVQVWEMAEHNMADWQNIYGWLTEHMADWQSIMADWQSIMADWQSIMADWQSIMADWQHNWFCLWTSLSILYTKLYFSSQPILTKGTKLWLILSDHTILDLWMMRICYACSLVKLTGFKS